jgi:hypothetical protein
MYDRPVANLLISREGPGHALIRSVDPFDTLEIHRIERSRWQDAPEQPGVYLLHGVNGEGKLTVYIGMSTSSIKARIRSHHVNPAKNWFGVLFAVPVANALLCPAIEAELIGQVTEAGVVDVIANVADEARLRGADDVHIEPAVEKIRDGLQLVLGSDIFTADDVVDLGATDAPLDRVPRLARAYRGQAAQARSRTDRDLEDATHAYVGAGILAWGRFEADEPDTRFRVLAGSTWRATTLDPNAATYDSQIKLKESQEELTRAGVLDAASMTFPADHVFDNWSMATRIISGKPTYAGAYHWQLLTQFIDRPVAIAEPVWVALSNGDTRSSSPKPKGREVANAIAPDGRAKTRKR